MITKKKVAVALAGLLVAVAGILKQCDDETPVLPNVPVVGADAGV